MRIVILSVLWSFANIATASEIEGNTHGPPKNSCIGYNAPDCAPPATTSACASDNSSCSSTIQTTTTETQTITKTPSGSETTVYITAGSDTASGYYPEPSDSITPHSPPVPQTTRTVDTATPATSVSSDSAVTSSTSCIHWSPAPPAVTAFSESDTSSLSGQTTSLSCITLSWSGSVHSEHPTPAPPESTAPGTPPSMSEHSTSKTTLTSTTTSGVGYPGGSTTSSGLGGTNFQGQGVRTQVASAIAALVAVAVLPFLLL